MGDVANVAAGGDSGGEEEFLDAVEQLPVSSEPLSHMGRQERFTHILPHTLPQLATLGSHTPISACSASSFFRSPCACRMTTLSSRRVMLRKWRDHGDRIGSPW